MSKFRKGMFKDREHTRLGEGSEAWKALGRAEKEQKRGVESGSKYPRFYESGTPAWRGVLQKRKDER